MTSEPFFSPDLKTLETATGATGASNFEYLWNRDLRIFEVSRELAPRSLLSGSVASISTVEFQPLSRIPPNDPNVNPLISIESIHE